MSVSSDSDRARAREWLIGWFAAPSDVAALARLLAAGLPLDEMIAMQDRADAIAPILVPAAYRNKGTAMDQDRDVLEALRGARNAIAASRRRAGL